MCTLKSIPDDDLFSGIISAEVSPKIRGPIITSTVFEHFKFRASHTRDTVIKNITEISHSIDAEKK